MKYIKLFNENYSNSLDVEFILDCFDELIYESSNYDKGSEINEDKSNCTIFGCVGDPKYQHLDVIINKNLENKVGVCMNDIKKEYPSYSYETLKYNYSNLIKIRVFDEKSVDLAKSMYGFDNITITEDDLKNKFSNGIESEIEKGVKSFEKGVKSIIGNSEIENKNKEYKDMTSDELNRELGNAIENEDYDLAVYLRDNFLKSESKLEYLIKMNKIFEIKKENKYIKKFEEYNVDIEYMIADDIQKEIIDKDFTEEDYYKLMSKRKLDKNMIDDIYKILFSRGIFSNVIDKKASDYLKGVFTTYGKTNYLKRVDINDLDDDFKKSSMYGEDSILYVNDENLVIVYYQIKRGVTKFLMNSSIKSNLSNITNKGSVFSNTNDNFIKKWISENCKKYLPNFDININDVTSIGSFDYTTDNYIPNDAKFNYEDSSLYLKNIFTNNGDTNELSVIKYVGGDLRGNVIKNGGVYYADKYGKIIFFYIEKKNSVVNEIDYDFRVSDDLENHLLRSLGFLNRDESIKFIESWINKNRKYLPDFYLSISNLKAFGGNWNVKDFNRGK